MITSRQLEAAGIGRGALRVRRARGWLQPLLRGVYVVGPAPPLPGARELAGLLACGPRSVISHRSAAALWGLAAPDAAAVDITLAGQGHQRRGGLCIHRTHGLHPSDHGVKDGLRVTAPARTLIDFAAQATGDELERAISEAYALRLVTEPQIHAAISRSPNRAGVGVLRACLAGMEGVVITRSKAERRLRRLLELARLPAPMSNTRVAGYEADLLWPQQRLIVEFDGYNVHGHRLAFESDRRRDAHHVANGYRVIRVTWLQLTREPFAVVANVARALIA
jgi:very-short-patch-repair endonuclease